MIVPEGMKLKLDPNDDFTHSPEPMSNYNESMYFNAFDKEQPVGLWVRLGNRPNEGHAEMTVCVYLPDKSVGFFYKRAPITNNDQMSAGGLTFRVIEPTSWPVRPNSRIGRKMSARSIASAQSSEFSVSFAKRRLP